MEAVLPYSIFQSFTDMWKLPQIVLSSILAGALVITALEFTLARLVAIAIRSEVGWDLGLLPRPE